MSDFNKYLSVTKKEEDWGFYVITAGYSKTAPNQNYPKSKEHPETHNFTWNKGRILNGYYLVFISKGNGIFESSQTSPRMVQEGTCFLLFPGIWHRYKPDDSSGWEEYWVGFKGSYPDDLMNKGFFNPDKPFVEVGLNEAMLTLFKKLIETVRSSKLRYHQIISGITLEILGMVNAIASNNVYLEDKESSLIAKAKFLLQEAIEKPVNMEELAKQLPMGYSKFRKVFKTVTGESPNQFYLNLRLNKAKELLDATALTINEIAYQTGFDSLFYFSKLFKKKNGIAPKFYRRRGITNPNLSV